MNLFDDEDPPPPPCADPNAKPSKAKRRPTVRRGYAWTPGTGPAGETCGTCCHRALRKGKYYKCDLVAVNWTGGYGTDILLRSLACRFWEPEASRSRPALAREPPRSDSDGLSEKKTLTPGPPPG